MKDSRLLSRLLLSPSVVTLFLWMIVPLGMTIYFSLIRYNLMQPERVGAFIGLKNYKYFITDPAFLVSIGNTILLLGSVVAITVVCGLFISLLIENDFPGRWIARILLVTPFFVIPTVNALMWKNMMMHPLYGVLAQVTNFIGISPIDWLTDVPLLSVILIIAWQWTPFATLIFMTSLQSMDREQLEASRIDGASYLQRVRYLYVQHLMRPISVVIMIEVIFLISVFAEIDITTSGGPGNASTNLTYLIFIQGLKGFDIGVASSGALFAVILANIVAVFLIRLIGKNLD